MLVGLDATSLLCFGTCPFHSKMDLLTQYESEWMILHAYVGHLILIG